MTLGRVKPDHYRRHERSIGLGPERDRGLSLFKVLGEGLLAVRGVCPKDVPVPSQPLRDIPPPPQASHDQRRCSKGQNVSIAAMTEPAQVESAPISRHFTQRKAAHEG